MMESDLTGKNFLQEAEKYAGHKLNRKNDLQEIINISVYNKREELLEELAFTAKYVMGLIRVLRKAQGIPEVESVEHIKKDLTENMKKITEQLRVILSGSENKTVTYFQEKYFFHNQESIENLNLLISDLEAVKKYLNYMKR